jgi:hypothetical protein
MLRFDDMCEPPGAGVDLDRHLHPAFASSMPPAADLKRPRRAGGK